MVPAKNRPNEISAMYIGKLGDEGVKLAVGGHRLFGLNLVLPQSLVRLCN